MTAHTAVSVDINGPIMVVTLDRPKANAIDAATSHALHDAVSRLETDDALRVAIVTGAGQRLFSAGWDLKAAHDGEAPDADHGPGGFAGITELFGRTKPIIAAVNGSAYGGGVELMLAADLVVAAETARFSLPEARLGVLADAGGVIRIAARLPRPLAIELLLTGRVFTAAEAHQWGLVNCVVADDDVLSTAIELARTLCEAAPLAVAATLDIIEAADGVGTQAAFTIMRTLNSVVGIPDSEDAAEGPRAFTEKRPPRWRGR